jgi:hypothetical protein
MIGKAKGKEKGCSLCKGPHRGSDASWFLVAKFDQLDFQPFQVAAHTNIGRRKRR